jgi:hypothetical protein
VLSARAGGRAGAGAASDAYLALQQAEDARTRVPGDGGVWRERGGRPRGRGGRGRASGEHVSHRSTRRGSGERRADRFLRARAPLSNDFALTLTALDLG